MVQPSVFLFLNQKYLYMENKTKQAHSILTPQRQPVRSQWAPHALSLSGPLESAALYTQGISLKSKFRHLGNTSLLCEM